VSVVSSKSNTNLIPICPSGGTGGRPGRWMPVLMPSSSEPSPYSPSQLTFRPIAILVLLDRSCTLQGLYFSFFLTSCALVLEATRLIRSTSSPQPWVRSLQLTAPASARLVWRAAPAEGCVRSNRALLYRLDWRVCTSCISLTRSARPQRLRWMRPCPRTASTPSRPRRSDQSVVG